MILWIEVTHPFGGKEVMSLQGYTALPDGALKGTRARLLTRTEYVEHLHKMMRARVARKAGA